MSREKGDKLETRIANLMNIWKTNNSGAKFDNADLANRKIIIECKYKDIPWFRPEKKEVKKLIQQSKKNMKDWIYIQENRAGTFVLLDLETFIELTEEWFKK